MLKHHIRIWISTAATAVGAWAIDLAVPTLSPPLWAWLLAFAGAVGLLWSFGCLLKEHG